MLWGSGHSFMALTFSGLADIPFEETADIPFEETANPKKITLLVKKAHFFEFAYNYSFLNTPHI